MHKSCVLLVAIAAILHAGAAGAYVGPGAGISLVGALYGLVSALVIAIGVVLLWPIRRVMRHFKGRAEAEDGVPAPPDHGE
jgi:uncharacterized membrane protein